MRYDRLTIALHWLTALLVAALWSIGQTIDFFARGSPRDTYRTVHILLGFTLVLVLLVRLIWRATAGRSLPPADAGWMGTAAKLVHWVLYALLALTLGLGLFNMWVRGDMIVGFGRIPAFDPSQPSLRETIEDRHALAANCLVILAGLHAAAALFHHFVLRDGVLRRMKPAG
jgi:cytochrome b561